MNITKYEHACVVVEEQGKKLVIDPGEFTTSFTDFSNITAVIVTHMHGDHLDPKKLQAILAANPTVRFFGTAEVAKQVPDLPFTAVTGGTAESVAPFKLAFYGEQHARIHPSIPTIQNVGVLVNDQFYYPGDSFTVPDVPIKVLALPIAAPWLKSGEAVDFLLSVKPNYVFPTHNGILSDIGHSIYNNFGERYAAQYGGMFTYMRPGESMNTDDLQ